VLSFQLLMMVTVNVAVIVLVRVGRLVHDPVSVRVPPQGFPGDRTPAGARLASRRGCRAPLEPHRRIEVRVPPRGGMHRRAPRRRWCETHNRVSLRYNGSHQTAHVRLRDRADLARLTEDLVLEERITVCLPLGLFWPRAVPPDVVLVYLRVLLTPGCISQARVQPVNREPVAPPNFIKSKRHQQSP
jgi:hypothetical protein